ncbi:hypothetical protein ONS95_014485 [Cadophora gregata]|uniref:uncharacterized protein n=1 Tax=Cadophora gregata TaxID=51156 RepID=UPI0026DBFD43|nr:uncharacterized protein ONS95_014485 [Cadophora gregata]KAK0112750.1 hypothetical protein ONS95_014485 [Cadophora gregata]KAK0124883.1 hypothetical protein ONS96_008761 [Cadophora gregata f. sp. sojae]
MYISRILPTSTPLDLSTCALSLVLSLLLGTVNTVAGHTLFTNLFIDGIDEGDGTCVRMPMTPHNATFPIDDLESTDMACGYNGMNGVARVCPVPASSNLTFQFREYPDNSQPGAIESSHLGPCAVYMKHVDSAIKDPAAGDGWFKVASMGYDPESKKWCTQQLAEKNGILDLGVKIPEMLAGGYYLVRPELLSLHDADKDPSNPQFYAGCAQIFVASEGTTLPKVTVKIPGYVGIKDKSVLFDIYNPVWPYIEPGPEVYKPGQSPGKTVKLLQRQDEGLLPGNARIVNANWWGVELDPYGDEDGCWNASTACFSQADTCYKSAPPTGSKNCRVWESRCSGIQGACKEHIFTGPPSFSYPPNLLPPTTLSSTESGKLETTSLTKSLTTMYVVSSTTSLPTLSISKTISPTHEAYQHPNSECTAKAPAPVLSVASSKTTVSIKSPPSPNPGDFTSTRTIVITSTVTHSSTESSAGVVATQSMEASSTSVAISHSRSIVACAQNAGCLIAGLDDSLPAFKILHESISPVSNARPQRSVSDSSDPSYNTSGEGSSPEALSPFSNSATTTRPSPIIASVLPTSCSTTSSSTPTETVISIEIIPSHHRSSDTSQAITISNTEALVGNRSGNPGERVVRSGVIWRA